jgi:hypothetical protein
MGGMIAILVGNIGNNLIELKNLINDIADGFEFEGKNY